MSQEAPELPQLARSGEVGFLAALGERAALFGDPVSGFEAWLWPIEVLRELRIGLRRAREEAAIDIDQLEQQALVRPEGFELVLSQRALELRVEVFAARRERLLLCLLHYRGRRDLWVELAFLPILRPMWPAGMGGQTLRQDEETGALVIAEELGRYAVFLGSPEAEPWSVPEERGAGHDRLRLLLPISSARGKAGPVPVVLAGAEVQPPPLSERARRGGEQAALGLSRSLTAIDEARAAWRTALSGWSELRDGERARWRAFLSSHARLACSEPAYEEAFTWSRIALERSWVEVDGVGRGVVAGVGPSRGTARPGYAWFFGGDALAAVRALSGTGDFDHAREILRFVASTQREDGKLMHELSLSAGLCRWTEDYPYAWYKGQVTPGFVAVLAAYLRASGDASLARELWPAAELALRWCRSTLDEGGRMQVPLAGIAAVEAGPLAGRIRCETFLQGIWISALAGAREMIADYGLEAGDLDIAAMEEAARAGFETFWSEERGAYGFAWLDDGGLCADSSAYTALALSRGIGDPERALASARRLARPELFSDWGARMFAEDASVYDPQSYNSGAVFPYLTNFVTLALFEHGLLAEAHASLDSQIALCGFDGAGLVPEHLEGHLARSPRRGVPHQLFSSAALLQSILQGMLGLSPDGRGQRLVLRPALPGGWHETRFENLRAGATRFDLILERGRAGDGQARDGQSGRTRLRARLERRDGPRLRIVFRPLAPPLSLPPTSGRVQGEEVALDARRLPSAALEIAFPEVELAEKLVLELELVEGPRVRLPWPELERGQPSRAARLIDADLADEETIRWRFAGQPASLLRLPFSSDREVSVEGASFRKGELVLEFPRSSADPPPTWVETTVLLRAGQP